MGAKIITSFIYLISICNVVLGQKQDHFDVEKAVTIVIDSLKISKANTFVLDSLIPNPNYTSLADASYRFITFSNDTGIVSVFKDDQMKFYTVILNNQVACLNEQLIQFFEADCSIGSEEFSDFSIHEIYFPRLRYKNIFMWNDPILLNKINYGTLINGNGKIHLYRESHFGFDEIITEYKNGVVDGLEEIVCRDHKGNEIERQVYFVNQHNRSGMKLFISKEDVRIVNLCQDANGRLHIFGPTYYFEKGKLNKIFLETEKYGPFRLKDIERQMRGYTINDLDYFQIRKKLFNEDLEDCSFIKECGTY